MNSTQVRLREAHLEAIFQRRIRQVFGGMVVKLAPTIAGMPDRLAILPGGLMFLVELKTETGVLSPIQVAWHARARSLNSNVHVLYGEEEIRQWIRDRAAEIYPT